MTEAPAKAAAEARAVRHAETGGGRVRTVYDEMGRHDVRAFTLPAVGFGSAAAGQRAANGTRFSEGSEDYHAEYTLSQIRDMSRALDRSNGIYQSIVNRLLDFVFGDDVKLQAQTGDETLNGELESRWREYWTEGRPEVRGLDPGPEVTRQKFRQVIVDGDCLTIRDQESGQIQIIAAERIYSLAKTTKAGNRIVDGVELDAFDRIVAYHLRKYGKRGELLRTDTERIEAVKADFIANRRRTDQTRGEPLLQTAFANLYRIDDTCSSEAAGWQLRSKFALAIEREAGPAGIDPLTGENTEASSDSDLSPRQTDIGDAILFFAKTGEKITPIKNDAPGKNFEDTLKMFLRLTGLPVGLSLEFLLLLWSDTNYSSGRASIKQVGRGVLRIVRLARQWLSNIYVWKVGLWKKELQAPATAALYKHVWGMHPYPAMDAQKENEAVQAAMESGTLSQSRACHMVGTELDEINRERAAELKTAAETVKAHNAAYPGQPITIQEVCPFLRQTKTPAGQPAGAASSGAAAGGDGKPGQNQNDDGDEPAEKDDAQDALRVGRAA